MAITPTPVGTVLPGYGANASGGAAGSAATTAGAYNNPTAVNQPGAFQGTSFVPAQPAAPAAGSAGGSATSSYPVVTSKPATDNYNAIQSTYTNTIAPNVNAAAQNSKAAAAAAANVPVMAGYNMSATKTGNAGEVPLQVNGQTYYATPQQQPATVSDIKSLLSGNDTSTTDQGAGQVTPSQTATNNTGINPTQENQNFAQQTQQGQDELTTAYNTFNSTIQTIQSGAFPLNPAQSALVQATNDAFNQMNTQAQLKAAALSSETGGISNKVNATAGELNNIISGQAAAVAKLEQGFQQQNYQMVTDSYKTFQDYETQKMDAITKLHDSVMSTYNTALDAAQKQQAAITAKAEADRTFAEQVKKDNQTIIDEKNANAIANADLNLKQATFNATYGSFMNSDGTPNTSVDPSKIPGYTTLPNGISIIDQSKLPPGVNKSQIGGLHVISANDLPVVNQWAQINSGLNKVQAEYNAIKNRAGVEPDQATMNTYNQDSKQLNSLISDLSTKNPQFSSLSGFYVSGVGGLDDKGNANFTSIRNGLNNSISTILPSAPPYGQVFTTPTDAQSYFTSTRQTDEYQQEVSKANQLAQSAFGRLANDGEILQVINGQ